MTVVDIHCHTFNADDLPVRGFLSRVVFDNNRLAGDVATLVDFLIQGRAPGYAEENAYLDHLLVLTPPEPGQRALQPMSVPDVDADADQALLELQSKDPDLVRRLDEQMPTSEDTRLLGLGGARTAVRWVKIFGMRRVDITGHLVGNFGTDAVDLFTPMLVDLGMGLGDVEKTTLSQQVALQEKISRLSMQGRLPVATSARVHPFVGFDPRRELRSRKLGDIVTPLEVLQRAIERYGFVGVKMYPPMGFTPTENQTTPEIASEEDAKAIDGILDELYEWCVSKHVPITVHCNASNDAADAYATFSRPSLWAKVLERHPDLHLNLGHFGGTGDKGKAAKWAVQIARLTNDYPHLYADVGCHRIDKPEVATAYEAKLRSILDAEETKGMRERLMFGSDWYMLALAPKNDQFLAHYRKLYAAVVGKNDPALDRFLSGAALDFLGFSEKARQEGNLNGERLRSRYAEHAPDRVPDWLA